MSHFVVRRCKSTTCTVYDNNLQNNLSLARLIIVFLLFSNRFITISSEEI